MSTFDKDAIEQFRLSILKPVSQFCGTEITTHDEDGVDVSNVAVHIPGCDIDYMDVEVRDLPDNRGGYSGVEVSVGCGDPYAYEEIFSNRDTALAFIRERIAVIVKDAAESETRGN